MCFSWPHSRPKTPRTVARRRCAAIAAQARPVSAHPRASPPLGKVPSRAFSRLPRHPGKGMFLDMPRNPHLTLADISFSHTPSGICVVGSGLASISVSSVHFQPPGLAGVASLSKGRQHPAGWLPMQRRAGSTAQASGRRRTPHRGVR
jgi:hypothetical protein